MLKTSKFTIKTPINNLSIFLITLLILVLSGTLGYIIIEKASFIDALFMSVITLSTVGYGILLDHDLSLAGKIFTILFIIIGVSVFVYAFGAITTMIIEGHLTEAVRRTKMRQKISQLKNHYIICGVSPIGLKVIQELTTAKLPYVIVEKNMDLIQQAQKASTQELLYVNSASTEEDTLIDAGVKTAKGIICCFGEDADNAFTIITAKEVNPTIFSISVGADEANEKKLKKIGADRVILPNIIGGKRIASLIQRPEVVNFLDTITHQENVPLYLEEILIEPGSKLDNIRLLDSNIRQQTDAIVIGIKQKNNNFVVNPKTTEMLCAQDKLIVLGEETQLKKLQKMASAN